MKAQTKSTKNKYHVCNICHQKYVSRHFWGQHLKVSHNKYCCTHRKCRYVAQTAKELNYHSYVHSGDITYKCDVCHHDMGSYNDLEIHKRRQHKLKIVFYCYYPGCLFTCGKDWKLREHQNFHTGDRPFRCRQCGHGFAMKSDLKDHIKISHLLPDKTLGYFESTSKGW